MTYRPRRPPAPAARLVFPLAAAVVLAVTVVPAAAGARAANGTGTITLCRRYQHITVHDAAGTRFVVKNDNYGGRRECLANYGRGANFTVTRSAARSADGEPVAYPFILRGCSWGTCSPRSGLPQPVAALAGPTVSWATGQPEPGQWNAALDIWFGKRAMTTGQANGAELMIWLRARGVPVPAHTPVAVVGHARWHLLHWRACRRGTCWTIVVFRRVRATSSVSRLSLAPFIARAERHGWIRRRWWLENIEAGFELWRGGTGLTTRSFTARP